MMKEACGLYALEEDNEDEAECHDFLIFGTFFTALDFVRPLFDRLTCPFSGFVCSLNLTFDISNIVVPSHGNSQTSALP